VYGKLIGNPKISLSPGNSLFIPYFYATKSKYIFNSF